MGNTGFSNLEEALGLVEDVEICVDRESMTLKGLKKDDLIDGVKVIDTDSIRDIIKNSHSTIDFLIYICRGGEMLLSYQVSLTRRNSRHPCP